MATVIGVSGKIASGKDYLTDKLTEELHRRNFTTTRTSFAYPLKAELDTAMTLFRINKNESAESFIRILATAMRMELEDAELLHSIMLEAGVLQHPSVTAYTRTVPIRSGLQELGTRIRRRQHPSYWTEKFVEFVDDSDEDFVFVSDARFPNEMDTVVNLDGLAIRLDIPDEVLAARRNKRDGVIYTPEQLNHISETALDDYPNFDVFVGPTFDIEKLVDQLFQIRDTKIS